MEKKIVIVLTYIKFSFNYLQLVTFVLEHFTQISTYTIIQLSKLKVIQDIFIIIRYLYSCT